MSSNAKRKPEDEHPARDKKLKVSSPDLSKASDAESLKRHPSTSSGGFLPAEIQNFRGRIVPSFQDSASSQPDHVVLFPRFKQDIGIALASAKEHKEKLFVRSGTSNPVKEQGDADGSVLNLKHFNQMRVIGKSQVQVDGGHTSEAFLAQLAKQDTPLVLPVSANPLQSIASNILNENEEDGITSAMARSLGPLSKYVTQIDAFQQDGKPVSFEGESGVKRCKESKAIVTQIKFGAQSAKGLRMHCVNFPLPDEKSFVEIAKAMFTASLPQTDLMMDVYNGPFNTIFVRITAIGYSSDGKDEKKKDLATFIKDKFPLVQQEGKSYVGAEVLEALSETGILTSSLDPAVQSNKKKIIIKSEQDLVGNAEKVHKALSSGRQLSSRLQFNSSNQLEYTEYEYVVAVKPKPVIEEPKEEAKVVSRARFLRLKPKPAVAEAEVAVRPRPFLEALSVSPIPGFRGEVYQQGDWGYDDHRYQYATSSYPAAVMTPFMVAYPLDEKDVAAALAFAKLEGKHVVARSGGHQYSGKSSGGSDTIVLSMQNFNTLIKNEAGRVELGPGVPLTMIAAQFKDWHITIPHGECPLVNIGGHAQSGGYGHLLRGFGLALDYVYAFDIVLADGKFMRCIRPDAKDPSVTDEDLNLKIFRAVLGGNAGSFGIVTRYIFNCIHDAEHPESYGYSLTRLYKKNVFMGLMQEVQGWTKLIETGEDDQKLKGLDFMMSLESSTLPWPNLPLLLVELVYSDPDGGVRYNDQFASIIKKSKESMSIVERLGLSEGKQSLSSLSDSFVRRYPATTRDGREWRYPYKKRVNGTTKAITDRFVTRFVDLMDNVLEEQSDVKLVFQMGFGGGASRAKGKDNVGGVSITAIPHRNVVYQFVFDLFYKDGAESTALRLQAQMQSIVDEEFSNGQEMRFFWGSFENTNISEERIRKMYYDNDQQYFVLQNLKQQIDPEDVFHTSLTVQLP